VARVVEAFVAVDAALTVGGDALTPWTAGAVVSEEKELLVGVKWYLYRQNSFCEKVVIVTWKDC
jgi:hypothetical protein